MEERENKSIAKKDVILSFFILLIMVFQIILILQNSGFMKY
ncbi:hypothetical protein [Tepidibacter aestuarii]|nr:hypothetical protein [Tepidibacter aestuarii]